MLRGMFADVGDEHQHATRPESAPGRSLFDSRDPDISGLAAYVASRFLSEPV